MQKNKNTRGTPDLMMGIRSDGRMFCALLGVVAAAAAQKCRCVNARFEMIVCVWVHFRSGFDAEMYR